MIDKKSYKALKLLYRKGEMLGETLDEITEHKDPNRDNPIIAALLIDKLIAMVSRGGSIDKEGGFTNPTIYYRITIAGRAYVEQRRRDLRNFWAPYLITTLIALLSLIASLAEHWGTILKWFCVYNPCK